MGVKAWVDLGMNDDQRLIKALRGRFLFTDYSPTDEEVLRLTKDSLGYALEVCRLAFYDLRRSIKSSFA